MSIFKLRETLELKIGVEKYCEVCGQDIEEDGQLCKATDEQPCVSVETEPTDIVEVRNPTAKSSLGWMSRAEEIRDTVANTGSITEEQLEFMQGVLAEHIVKVNGETVNWKTPDIDQRLSSTLTYAVFLQFVTACHLPEEKRGKSRQQRRSRSPATPQDTTAPGVTTRSNGSSDAPIHSTNLEQAIPGGTA